jgi:hypothetical protein
VEAAQLHRFARHDVSFHLSRQFAGYAVVAVNAVMYVFRGVDRQVVFMADAADRLDVVGVVVGNKHIMNGTQAEAVVPEMLLQRSYSYSNIYNQAIRFGVQVVAIAAATAPKGYKFQHI